MVITVIKRFAADTWWLSLLYVLSSCILAFPMVSVGAVLNVELKFEPSDISYYYATIFIPWSLRAIFGFLSDSVPIFGSRRTVYYSITLLGTAVCYILFGQVAVSLDSIFLIGTLLNVCLAFSESVLDAVAVELAQRIIARSESPENRITVSTDIQSLNMLSRTVGTLVSVLTAGFLSQRMSPRTIISMTSVFPVLAVAIAMFVNLDHINPSTEPRPNLLQQTKRFGSYIKGCVHDRRMPRELFSSLAPVALPGLFVLLYASAPTSTVAYWNFLFTKVNFDQFEYHIISVCTTIGSIVGTITYWGLFRNIKDVRSGFLVSVITAAVATCSRLLIVNGWISLGFICGDEILVNAANRLALMPVQVYASIAASIPAHAMYEGFVFGVFAGIENWGGTLSAIFSGLIVDHLSLHSMILTCAVLSLAPLMALVFIRTQYYDSRNGDSSLVDAERGSQCTDKVTVS